MNRFGLSLEGLPWHAHPLPIHLRAETVGTQRCMLVGDAAGLVDAFLGEGIRYAIQSGRLAAEAILHDTRSRLLGGGQDAHQRRPTTGALRGSNLLQLPGPRPIRSVKRNQAFTRVFMDLLGGNATYRELSRRLPLYFLQSVFMRTRT